MEKNMPEAAAVTLNPSWVGSVREYIFVLVFLLSHAPSPQLLLAEAEPPACQALHEVL